MKEEVLVSCKIPLNATERYDLEQHFIGCGASSVVKYHPAISVFHLSLEPNVSWRLFQSRVQRPNLVEKTEVVRPLDLAGQVRQSSSSSVFVHPNLPPLEAWWFDKLGIPHAHRKTRGRNVRVAVIDTGISHHPELFELDFEQVRQRCAEEASSIWTNLGVIEYCRERWMEENGATVGRLNIEQIVKDFRVGARLKLLPAYQALDAILRTPFSHRSRGLPTRIMSANAFHEITLDDFCQFAANTVSPMRVQWLVEQVMHEQFERDWSVYSRACRAKVRSDDAFLFLMLSSTWTAGDRDVPWVIDPASRGATDVLADTHGHGTHMAGLLFSAETGICPEARGYILRVCDDKTPPNTAHLVNCLANLHNQDVRVAVAGVSLDPATGPLELALERAFERAHQDGVLVIVPVGFYQNRTVLAQLPHVLSVGSVNADGSPAHFNAGLQGVDLWSYGGGGSHPPSTSRNEWRQYADGTSLACLRIGGGFDCVSGSSLAAAQVAGVAVLLESIHHFKDPDELLKKLMNCRDPRRLSAATSVQGTAGVLDARLVS